MVKKFICCDSKKSIIKISILSFLVVGIISVAIFNVGDTYAVKPYTITFNNYEAEKVLKTCRTDVNGKLDKEDCIDTIGAYCSMWSLDSKLTLGGQTNKVSVFEFEDMIFTEDKNYYCVAGTSQEFYSTGCYVCKDDSNIIKWGANSNSDSKCSSGYQKHPTITDEASCAVKSCYVCSDNSNIMQWKMNGEADSNCPNGYFPIEKNESECKIIESCYECKSDKNIMKWDNNGDSDSACSSGYITNNKSKNECKTIIPESCYECKSDKNIMKWDNNGDSDSACSSGYITNNKSKNECKTIIPESCYECKNDKNIMKWDNSGDSDSACSSGYITNNKSKNECKTKVEVEENPKTGKILILMVWVIGLGALGYSVYYFRNRKYN